MPNDQAKPFLDYTQEQLDQAYDQLVWAPHRDAIQAEIRKDCEAVRKAVPPRTERYGKSERQVLDIFAPKRASGVPVLVYLHGGAWLRGSRLDVAYPAPAVTGRGAALVVTDFNNVSEVPLPAMVEQCRDAIVLPQALRIALPAMTNEFIALFKNTTLVLIVSIFDLLGIAQAALADPAWVGMNMEAYVFAGAIYWFACFGLSQWSRSREKRLQAAYGR